MSDTFQKIHGTTVDRFSIGSKNQTITLTGQTVGAVAGQLLDRESQSYFVDTAVFFSAYIVGVGTNVAAYEIKGCYILADQTVRGYTVAIYEDTGGFVEPTVAFNNGEIIVTVNGVNNDTINWSSTINLILI